MVKLVILIETPENQTALQSSWPEFLHLAEAMPGLRRESSGQVTRPVFGQPQFHWIHELFFDTSQDLQAALASEKGREAGRLLQTITQGKVILFVADHKEDIPSLHTRR